MSMDPLLYDRMQNMEATWQKCQKFEQTGGKLPHFLNVMSVSSSQWQTHTLDVYTGCENFHISCPCSPSSVTPLILINHTARHLHLYQIQKTVENENKVRNGTFDLGLWSNVKKILHWRILWKNLSRSCVLSLTLSGMRACWCLG